MSDHSITTQPATGSALRIRWWQAVLLLCLFVSATGLGIYWGQTHIVAGIENGFLEVDAEHLDFGEVWVQDKFQWTLPITNTSSEPVEVLEFRSSCNCLSIEPKTLVLAPGETSDVHLTLDLTTRNPEEAAKASRRFSVRIAPIITGGLAQYTGWEVEGSVLQPLIISPNIVDFGESLVCGEVFPSRTIRVESRRELNELIVKCDEAVAIVEVTRDHDNSRLFSVRVTPHATLPVGEYRVPLVFTDRSEGSASASEVPVPLHVNVVHDIRFGLPLRHLGAHRVGEIVKTVVSLKSRTGKPFLVEQVTSASADFAIDRITGSDQAPPTFQLAYRVSESGEQSAAAEFHIRYVRGNNVEKVPLVLHFFGIGELAN